MVFVLVVFALVRINLYNRLSMVNAGLLHDLTLAVSHVNYLSCRTEFKMHDIDICTVMGVQVFFCYIISREREIILPLFLSYSYSFMSSSFLF